MASKETSVVKQFKALEYLHDLNGVKYAPGDILPVAIARDLPAGTYEVIRVKKTVKPKTDSEE